LDLFSFLQSFLLFAFAGNARQGAEKIAEAIIDAIKEFSQKGSVQSVKKVKVVIILPQVLTMFCASMKKREKFQVSPQPSVMSSIKRELLIFMKCLFLTLLFHEK
jgi:poly [ADP-ribose] polymerase 10/14/15